MDDKNVSTKWNAPVPERLKRLKLHDYLTSNYGEAGTRLFNHLQRTHLVDTSLPVLDEPNPTPMFKTTATICEGVSYTFFYQVDPVLDLLSFGSVIYVRKMDSDSPFKELDRIKKEAD